MLVVVEVPALDRGSFVCCSLRTAGRRHAKSRLLGFCCADDAVGSVQRVGAERLFAA